MRASLSASLVPEPLERRTLFASLTNITNLPDYEVAPDIATDAAGGLHATYQGGPSNAWQVMYMYKPAGGAWSAPLNLGGSNIADPHIAVGGQGNPHIVYAQGNEIYWMNKFNGVWNPPTRLSSMPQGRSVEPDIVIGPDRIFVSWHDESDGGGGIGTDWDIHTRVWQNGAWGAEVKVSTSADDDVFPSMTAGGLGAMYVVWHNTPSNQVLWRKRDPNGVWSNIERADSSAGRSFNPSIAIDSLGTTHMAWHDDNNGWKMAYQTRTATGTWGTVQYFDAGGAATDAFAHVAVAPNDGVAVGWVDYNNAYLVRKPAGGSFGAIKTVGPAKGAKDNSLVFDPSGNVHFLFQGNKGGTNGGSWDLWHYVENSAGL